jgi:hypothetical protein
MIVHTYTFWQIKRYMKDNGYSIRNVTPYKGNRYGSYYRHYDSSTK